MTEPGCTKLPLILPYILTQLQEVTELPAAACFLSQRDTMPYDGVADQYVWVRVEDATDDLPVYQGAGRLDTREDVTFSVTVRTRLGLDPVNADTEWLTNASLGHLYLVHKVAKALVEFHPSDGQGNLYSITPVEPRKAGKPRKDKVPEWGESVRYFGLLYKLDFS